MVSPDLRGYKQFRALLCDIIIKVITILAKKHVIKLHNMKYITKAEIGQKLL